MDAVTVTAPRLAEETTALLLAIGRPPPGHGGPAEDADTISPTDLGMPDPHVGIAEIHLPVRWGACRARLYAPTTPQRTPLLLWLHGGGFVGGSARDLDPACADLAARATVTVVSLEYRLAPENPYPAAVHDTLDALQWLLAHGQTMGGDGTVSIGGQSAGASIAAGATLLARDTRLPLPRRQILCYPTLDFGQQTESTEKHNGVFHTITPGQANELAYLAGQTITAYAAPLRSEHLRGLPHTLVVAAGRDPLRDDAHSYATRLDEDGVPTTYVEYAGTMHAFLNFHGALSASRDAVRRIARYLQGQPGGQGM